MSKTVFLTVVVWTIVSPLVLGDQVTEAEKLFALKVRPLLREKCLACHGADPEKT